MRKKVLFVGVALLGFAIPHQAWATPATLTAPSAVAWGTDATFTASDDMDNWYVRGSGCQIYPDGTDLDEAVLKATRATTCVVTASNVVGMTAQSVYTFNKKANGTLTFPDVSAKYVGGARVVATGNLGTSPLVYSTTTTGCSVSSNKVTSTVSSCVVKADVAADANYEAATQASATVTFSKSDQSTLSISTGLAHLPSELFTLDTSGGSGTGAVTYTKISGTCTLTGRTITGGTNGTVCIVSATKAADSNYNATTSAQVILTTAKGAQVPLKITNTPTARGNAEAFTLTTSGGSSSSDPTFAQPSGSCTLDTSTGAVVVPSSGNGSCVFTATKAADSSFNSVTSAPVTFTYQASKQPTFLIATDNSTPTNVGTLIALTTSGGANSGSPTVAYAVTGANCYLDGTALQASAAGKCVVTATASYTGFTDAVAKKTFTFVNVAQGTLTITSTTGSVGTLLTLATSGGSGSGAVTYKVTGTGCQVTYPSGTAKLNKKSTGTCSVIATKAASAGYNAKSSTATTVTFS